ncbi:AAA family ATPase [Cohnella fermenti]|uniref:GAF domain-containing protein n=1 Tax=Cohnella fermenti TaxID=2565925 RepID=A0A4S4C6J6_9BACL|nr:GAF domain-containing protein [Cohnella fermenti]
MDFPTVTLREYMMGRSALSADSFLRLARTLAASVERLHRQQLLHLDLRPERIAVARGGEEARLLDSENSVRRKDDGRERLGELALEPEALPYCSPENTGRMMRSADERSDLYSLGAIYYELLTGRLPFEADSPSEWIYRHLTQSPPSFAELGISLPSGFEPLVLKLLEKNPDKRYPSAGFLLADLDKLERSPDAVFTESGFHGRDYEISVLTQALYSAGFGSTELVYLAGDAGIGKTSLMNELFRQQANQRQHFYIAGKFDQLSKESPYHPIIEAFRGLLRHLLGEPRERVERWRARLQAALGPNAGVLTAILPELDLLLEDTPDVEELPASDAQKRFIYAFRRLVQTLASKEHPIVLFIDDLHWANASSLQLLQALLSDPENQHMLFVFSYRPSETDRSKLPGFEADKIVARQAVVRHLSLSPLGLEQMSRIVLELLNCDEETALSLTELLYPQSRGNPYHLKEILLSLQKDRILSYVQETRRWQWDLGRFLERSPSYAVQDLIGQRLARLCEEAQQLLKLASCAGSVFEPRLVEKALAAGGEACDAHWRSLELEGIIVPAEDDHYRFSHDNIQKTIYARMDEEEKQLNHIRIGRLLMAEDNERRDRLFEAVNQWNRGHARITNEQERLALAEWNLEAGQRAKSSSAHDIALGYFSIGAELLAERDWERNFGLSFELRVQKAECEYLCGHAAESERQLDALLGRARTTAERSRVQLIRIMQYINQGRYLEGTELGLQCLREHHVHIPSKPGKALLWFELLRIETLLRDRYDRLARKDEMTDPDRIAAMNLILAIVPSTFFTDKSVFVMLICRAILLSLKHGNSPVSAAAYTSYGIILGQLMGNFKKGFAIAEVGVELAERCNVASVKSKSYTMFGGVLCQFGGDAREGEAYLHKALRTGMDSGDYVFASYAMGAHVNSLYTRASLSDLARQIADYLAVLDTTKDEFVRQNFYLYQQWILALQGRTEAADSFDSPGFDEREFLGRIGKEETSGTTMYQYCAYKTQLIYLDGRFEEAVRWASQAAVHQEFSTHLPHWPECVYYGILAELAVYRLSDRRSPLRKGLKRELQLFRRWAECSPANYLPRWYLLQADYASTAGDDGFAEERYDRALREAWERGDFHVTGVGGELASNHYRSRNRIKTALHYAQVSLEGYRQWQLPGKIKRMDEQIFNLRLESVEEAVHETESLIAASSEMAAEPANDPRSGASVDLAAILRTTQAISHQIDIDAVLAEIMNTILRHSGAAKGALITSSNDELFLQVYLDSEDEASPSPLVWNDNSLLPEGLIRYVFRTQEDVVHSGEAESWVMHNPYLAKRQPESALCLPIARHGTTLGVLYLENKHTGGVFAPERVSVLRTMATQAILMCVLQSLPDPLPSQADEDETLELGPSPVAMDEPLTERELEVLSLLASGMSNKEIADRLIIAIGTVKVHVKNIFAKLKVNRRTKAVAQAKELKLLD